MSIIFPWLSLLLKKSEVSRLESILHSLANSQMVDKSVAFGETLQETSKEAKADPTAG